MSKDNGFVKGAFWGLIVGGAAAILMTPKSGEETKASLKHGVKNAGRELKKLLQELEDNITGQIDHLQNVAQDLKGEARRDSVELINRAQTLKADLGDSTATLAKSSGELGQAALNDIKRLVGEGNRVIEELEGVTKRLLSSAKDKIRKEEESEF